MGSFIASRRLIISALATLVALLAFWWASSTSRVIAQAPPACIPPPSGMVSWWPGDGNANDIQGNNNGTLMNGATFAAGKVGQAFSLDGVDDFVNIPDAPSLDLLTVGTISMWAYFNDASNLRVLIAKGTGNGNAASYTWGTYADVLRFDLYKGDASLNYATVSMPTSLLVGGWNFLTATWDGSTLSHYRNGVLQSSVPYSFVRLDTPYAVIIGLDTAGNPPINGRLDEIELYNRTLSASEIQALYNADSAGKCKPQCIAPPPDMVSWWTGDGNANDIQGSNQGTLAGGATFAAGKVGQAFSFNGTDAYVRVPDNANLYPGAGSFTVDAWIKTTQMSSGSAYILTHYECANNCPSFVANSLYAMFVNGNGKLGGFLRDTAHSEQTITSAKVVADGVYHHIALVRDTTGLQMQLYVDGVLDATAPLTVTGTIKDDDGEPDPFTIGAIIQGGTNQPTQLFVGEVDEVEYFNRALTASEIHAIFNAGSAGKCEPLMVPVDSKATYLHTTCDDPALPTIVDLAAFGLAPGDGMKLNYSVAPPGFSFSGCSGPFVGIEDTGVLGVFSSSNILLPPSAHPRVAGALEAGADYVSGATFFCSEPNDIPQDFRLSPSSDFTIQIPAGATHLFLAIADNHWADNCGNIKVTFERVVLNQPPVARCQNVTVSAGANCTASASIDNGSSDPDGDTITIAQSPPGPYSLGATNVLLTITDSQGASSSCTSTVTVVDNTPPVINPLPNVFLPTQPGSCSAVFPLFPPFVRDNCTPVNLAHNAPPGNVFPVGTTVVTWTATDLNGNSSTRQQTITVLDFTRPTITVCPLARTFAANGSSQLALPDLTSEVIAFDNCTAPSSLTITQSPAAGTIIGLGNTTVTLTVTDAAGNQSTCTTVVTLACPVCSGPAIVVSTAIELDANNLAGTAGLLAPFASFDGSTITIDLGDRPLQVTSSGRISVLAGSNLQPPSFHQAGNHGTPNLRIKSTCTLLIDESTRGMVNARFRSLTGVIETNAQGGRAGDINLEFDGAITINGGVQSFQERLPDNANSLSGAITIKSVCGQISIGPAAWIVTWGENPGTGAINIQSDGGPTGGGDILIDGLVMNRTNHTLNNNAPPTINVHAAAGSVTINGGNLVLDEFNLMGTKYDLTSGLLTISREATDVGEINVQARQPVAVSRVVTGLTLNRTNYAAVATVVNSNSAKGGKIRVRALQGSIRVRDRAFQADGRGNNEAALIELVAALDIVMLTPAAPDSEHTPTLTTAAQAVNGVGKGGTNVLRSCNGQVRVNAGAAVLATGSSAPGTNELTAGGGVTVLGTVAPTAVTGASCSNPPPLF